MRAFGAEDAGSVTDGGRVWSSGGLGGEVESQYFLRGISGLQKRGD